MDLKTKIRDYASTLENVQKDHPFQKFPEYEVFRHTKTGKWFALIMTIDRNKLGISGDGQVTVIDVKAEPEEISILINAPGYFPGYHMNKNHWLTILLDGTVKEEQIREMIKNSYALTR
ncbi:MmcQ/YjbR family DNA-binding protein [Enterococcus sp.]|uniref:MmcQ/YjbR family DNA-binding protein n=1 Tax=Enterococcus sp. TaxID=35783 RepID=UPI0025C504AC|nr:MmcQ/YjbR family DNA-binding protein [Enterococcus sp.]